MIPARRSLARRLLVSGLAGFVLLLSGCVYLRLLEFKLQLNKFDRYFALHTDDGVAIICQEPVIRVDDVRWFGVGPELSTRLGHAEQWRVRMVKQLPPGITEERNHDLLLELGFADDKLNRIAIPESYFTVMPKAFFLGVIKSLGRGKIDRTGKSMETAVTAPDVASARPKLAAVSTLLGRPTESRVEAGITLQRYRYAPATKEETTAVFDMILRFRTASGELAGWQAVTPAGKIGLNFAPPE